MPPLTRVHRCYIWMEPPSLPAWLRARSVQGIEAEGSREPQQSLATKRATTQPEVQVPTPKLVPYDCELQRAARLQKKTPARRWMSLIAVRSWCQAAPSVWQPFFQENLKHPSSLPEGKLRKAKVPPRLCGNSARYFQLPFEPPPSPLHLWNQNLSSPPGEKVTTCSFRAPGGASRFPRQADRILSEALLPRILIELRVKNFSTWSHVRHQ